MRPVVVCCNLKDDLKKHSLASQRVETLKTKTNLHTYAHWHRQMTEHNMCIFWSWVQQPASVHTSWKVECHADAVCSNMSYISCHEIQAMCKLMTQSQIRLHGITLEFDSKRPMNWHTYKPHDALWDDWLQGMRVVKMWALMTNWQLLDGPTWCHLQLLTTTSHDVRFD